MSGIISRLKKAFNQGVDHSVVKSSCTTPDRSPINPALPINRSRRHALQLLGLGGVSMGLTLLRDRSFAQSSGARPALSGLTTFSFEVVTVNAKGQVIKRNPGQSRSFTEMIGDTRIEMVAIRGGTFMMGQTGAETAELMRLLSPTDYNEIDWELPRHSVTLRPFSMGKYPVTQAQWRAVAGLPKVRINLIRDPSHIKGDNRPVEDIDWDEAVEFCDRLSVYTKRIYTLPSEAQWEYACRAGTTTPFHFGETITTDLANYDGNYTYGSGPKGTWRRETTEVGSFPPNAFGLYDMHGNVYEWCLDYSHNNYIGAPVDGSAWGEEGVGDNVGAKSFRMRRGGSWCCTPRFCRSACRSHHIPRNISTGFRVVSVPF